MNKKQLKRFVKVVKKTWSILTLEEKILYYVDTGKIGFIEDIAKLLHITKDDLSHEVILYILQKII